MMKNKKFRIFGITVVVVAALAAGFGGWYFMAAAGDVVLRDIAAAIQSCIRSSDILVRYGGDEFLLLFPKMSENDMAEKNKRIKEAVANIVYTEYPTLHLSVSIGGVCGVHPIMEAIRQADKQMYENKRTS